MLNHIKYADMRDTK